MEACHTHIAKTFPFKFSVNNIYQSPDSALVKLISLLQQSLQVMLQTKYKCQELNNYPAS